MNKKDFLLIRDIRKKIVDICFKLYDYDISAFESAWRQLDVQTHDMLENQADYLICEMSYCIQKKNWIRARDLLLCIDDILKKRLETECSVYQPWQRNVWNENYAVLRRKNAGLAERILKETGSGRVEVKAGGTECCGIWIHDRNATYQLFSLKDPWLECKNRIENGMERQYTAIYQWGFNGGFLTGAIEEKFPKADIHVFVSNTDIFQAVLQNICLEGILDNDRLCLHYDPYGLDFARCKSDHGREGECAYIVDRAEYRAFRRNEDKITDGTIKECQKADEETIRNKGTVGMAIYSKIKNSILDDYGRR